jgi:hypothetical protein
MLVSQDFAGVRAERADRHGIRKSKNKKERSPTAAACKRTPPAQLASELCHLVVERKPGSPVTAVPGDNEQASIPNRGTMTTIPSPPALVAAPAAIVRGRSSLASLCGDGLYNFEKDIRMDYFQYMLEMDSQTQPNVANMQQQPEVRWDMRTLLVDFLVQIHGHFYLKNETLHLAINLLDRYMSKAVVIKKHYQLVGMTCLWIASKYEDGQDKVPKAFNLCSLSCDLYDEAAFATMERHVLKTINWDIGHPTTETFLQCYLMFSMNVSRVRQVARLLIEVTLYDACFLPFNSHTIAISCLYAARRMLGIPRGLLSENDERLPCLRELEKSLRFDIPQTLFNKYNVHGNMRASLIVKNWLDSNPFTKITDDVGTMLIRHPQFGVLSPVNFNVDRPIVLPGEVNHLETRDMIPFVEQPVCEEKPNLISRPHPLSPIPSPRAMTSVKVEPGRLPR